MMISLTNLLLVINTILIVGIAVFYFNKNYVIVSMEDMNTANEALDEYQKLIDQINAEEEASEEKAGGEGSFFRDCIEEEYDEEEEDE